ncbi:hypothetical protein [Microcoleus sp. CAWBG58]|uniref:hypothetical protein n=1 Tax=Microcoleus sp. CAWBG58 TaxID=2841651 RepID=UPI0025CEA853|nr:hypothetical protein [Microcoleus sp. CAWBG58]
MATLTNLNTGFPPELATDAEVVSAIANHMAATDPHPAYLTQAEGDGRYRRSAIALTDTDIPAAIARDAEVASAIADHVAATDPHPTYLTVAEADRRYQLILPISIAQVQVAPPAQISYPGGGQLFDLGFLGNLNPGSAESLFAVAVYIQFISNGQTFPHSQASGATILAPIQWQNTGRAQPIFNFPMESHDTDTFTGGIRLAATGQLSTRMVQVFFTRAFTASLIRATFVRLR